MYAFPRKTWVISLLRETRGVSFFLETVLCACAGNGSLWGEVGRFWEGAGGCFRSELCQLLLSLWPLALWLCGTAIVRDAPSPKESTMEVQFGDFCVGIFSGGSENFHIFRGCLVAQLKLLSIMTWTELGKSQAVPCCACLRIQPTGFWFPSGGFTSEPFPLTDLSLWGLESQERAGAHSKGFFGSRERAGESGKLNWAFRNHLQKVCA